MTYEEYYEKCTNAESLIKGMQHDLAYAKLFNPDRIKIIKEAAAKVINEKFPDYDMKNLDKEETV